MNNRKKGITTLSLVFYIVAALLIIGVITTISVSVSKSMKGMKEKSEGVYFQSRLDKHISDYISKGYSYEIHKSTNPSYQGKYDKLKFKKNGNDGEIEHVFTFKITDENKVKPERERIGYIFLDDKLILENVLEFDVYEQEKNTGKLLTTRIKLKINDQEKTYINVYGAVDNGNNT